MRLASFARSTNGDSNLYGLPEMDIARSASTVFDSNREATVDGVWRGARSHYRDVTAPPGSVPPVVAGPSPVTGAGTVNDSAADPTMAATGVIAGAVSGGTSASSFSPTKSAGDPTSSLPVAMIVSPEGGGDGSGSTTFGSGVVGAGAAGSEPGPEPGPHLDSAGRRKSTKSIRSSATSADTSSPAGMEGVMGFEGGNGGHAAEGQEEGKLAGWATGEGGAFSAGGINVEAVAQGFAEEAELEALQIDKNDLKLVFGRPFARGKTSEVYQVTHAGKNRAAKVSTRAVERREYRVEFHLLYFCVP